MTKRFFKPEVFQCEKWSNSIWSLFIQTAKTEELELQKNEWDKQKQQDQGILCEVNYKI